VIRLALALALAQSGYHAWIATIPVALVALGRPAGEIGAIVGSASVFNLVAAALSGGLIDRYGGRGMYLAGCGALVIAAVPIAFGWVDGSSSFAAWVAVRMMQGVGLAAVLPAVMSLVPDAVPAARVSTALAFVGVAGNCSLALTPPVSLLLLERFGLSGVAVATIVSVGTGAAIIRVRGAAWSLRVPSRARTRAGLADLRRAVRPAWRPVWLAPLACVFLFVAHWGVVTGYLAQRTQPVGADIGLFFTADAVALLTVRIPAGWLAGRIAPLPLLLAGVAINCAGVAVLFLPPTTALLVVAGIGTGVGSALFFPVILVELNRRSDAHDRGSAFALQSVAFGSGIAAGSLGIAAFYDAIGFEAALAIGVVACAASGIVALADRSLRHAPPQSAAEIRAEATLATLVGDPDAAVADVRAAVNVPEV
jgi:MFS family permease